MPASAEVSGKAPEVILVVDGDVLVRMAIAGYLRECGFRVIEAVDAREATTVLAQADIPVDVLFSVVEMAGMDGFALKRWAREHRPDVIVVLTGTPARAVEAAADLCKSGPDLAKPYEPQLLLDRIRRLLAERTRKTRRWMPTRPVPAMGAPMG